MGTKWHQNLGDDFDSLSPQEQMDRMDASYVSRDMSEDPPINAPSVSEEKSITSQTSESIMTDAAAVRNYDPATAAESTSAAQFAPVLASSHASTYDDASAMAAINAELAANGFSGRDAADITPSTAASSAYTNSANAFPTATPNATNLGNFSPGYNDQLKSFSNSLSTVTSSMNGSASNLQVKQGLAFIAGTTSKMFEGIDLPGMESMKSFMNLGNGQLYRLASMGGDSLRSLGDGLKSVTSSLNSMYQAGVKSLQTITSSVSNAVNTVLKPAINATKLVYTLTDPRLANIMVQSNLNFLPSGIRQAIGYKAQSVMAGYTGSLHQKVGSILGLSYSLNNISGQSVNSMYSSVYYSGNGTGGYSNNYYTLADEKGAYAYGLSSYNGSSQQYNGLVESVSKLCGTNSGLQTNYTQSGDKKDIFDILLQNSLQTGAGNVVSALMNCGQSSQYLDGRSLNVIRNNSSTVAQSGDIYTYKTITDAYGSDVTRNIDEDALALFVNTKYSEDANADLDSVLTQFGLTKSEIVRYKAANNQVYSISDSQSDSILDGSKLTAAQYADQEFQDQVLEPDYFAAANAAMYLYSSDEAIV